MYRVWLVALVVVVVGSLLPGSSPAIQAMSSVSISDKWLHFLAYAFLAYVPTRLRKRQTAIRICCALIVMGVAIEGLQMMVPGRSCELLDAVSDAAGVVCTFLLTATWMRFSRSSQGFEGKTCCD